MNINKQSSYKLLLTGLLGTSLAACGGSSKTVEDLIEGLVVDSSNYEEVFQTGLVGSAQLIGQLLYAGNEVDLEQMTVLEESENSAKIACDNVGGTLLITQVDSDTRSLDFDDCNITYSEPSVKYDGKATVSTVVNSGSLDDLGSYDTNWSATQTVLVENLSQTSPIVGGDTNTSSGNLIINASNDTSTGLNSIKMTSSDLIIDSKDADSGEVKSYAFSDLSYDIQENTTSEMYSTDLDFTADITDIGYLQLTTTDALTFNSAEVLQSGAVTVSTGSSAVKAVAQGSDVIEVSLDTDNDGDFEFSTSTTWSSIAGDLGPGDGAGL